MNLSNAGTSLSKLSANENFSSPAFYHQNISKESFTKDTHSDYELVEDSQRNTYLQNRKCEDNFNSFTNEVGNGKIAINRVFKKLVPKVILKV